jgi:hypothetical protein
MEKKVKDCSNDPQELELFFELKNGQLANDHNKFILKEMLIQIMKKD